MTDNQCAGYIFVPRLKQLGIGADMETPKAARKLAQKTREQNRADQAACFHNRFPEMHFLYGTARNRKMPKIDQAKLDFGGVWEICLPCE